MDLSLKRLRREEGELLGVLADSWDARSSTPVVVQVSELVGQHLQLVLAEIAAVEDDVVGSRRDGALSDVLRHQEEAAGEKVSVI
jgi:hypothetical protein